jgi:LPXTG-site transpeptidase (sortase) family protein
MPDILANLTTNDIFALSVGLLFGVGVLLLIRAGQAWRHRIAFGLDIYHAQQQQSLLVRLAILVIGTGILLGGTMFWLQASGLMLLLPLLPSSDSVAITQPFPAMRLYIPVLGVDAEISPVGFVGQDWDVALLGDRIGHLTGSVLPGDTGNAALVAHVTVPGLNSAGPFYELEKIQPGDRISVRRDGQLLSYTVTSVGTVEASEIRVVLPSKDTQLTLITCADWDGNQYAARLVVVALPTP